MMNDRAKREEMKQTYKTRLEENHYIHRRHPVLYVRVISRVEVDLVVEEVYVPESERFIGRP